MRLSDKISGSLSSKYDKSILTTLNESCKEEVNYEKQDLKEEENYEITWDNYEDYSEEEIEEINNILNNLDLTAIKHEGDKEEGYSVAVKDNNSGMVFWLDYIKEGPDIYGEFNQYIFKTDNSDDRIRQAIQTSMYEDGTTIAFEAMESEGLQYLEDKGLVTYTDNNDMIFESSLNEDVKDDTASAAKQIALEIQERGIMGFDEIDSMAADILGITVEELRDQQLDTDIHISLNYEGIDNNMSTGDFYTQEYAEEHPEVLEESEKVDEDTEEYLEPRYNGRKSFYKKAKVVTKDNGDEELYSYGTHVGGVRSGKPYSKGKFSQTTSRHQKEFFKQRGYDHNKVDIEESDTLKLSGKMKKVPTDKNKITITPSLSSEIQKKVNDKKLKKEDLKEETLNETDATPEFLEDLKNLINNHMRVSDIAQITLDNMEGQEYAVIAFESGGVKRINITANSNLAVARAILFELA